MANSLSDADMLMTKGANSLEVDVRFTSNGTASRVYHGFPCDCLRVCDGETLFTEYLDYIRGVSSVGLVELHDIRTHATPKCRRKDGAKYKDELLFLVFDLKTSDISENQKYGAGIDIATKLLRHLWANVSDTSALNVLLCVRSTDDSELFRGALDTLSNLEDAEHWIELVGFDFGVYQDPEDISEAFARLDISGHRWQSSGITNCLVDFRGDFQLPEIVANRDGNGYVDKAYVWTVDDPPTITRFINHVSTTEALPMTLSHNENSRVFTPEAL
ncbi:hypothetical protein HPB49_005010 [Dermacentor silvarum]|uniref:Uncharacterized protein n=1 Tax=Dermacentor silvarum TaxID=543639 RepID=A0ACB8CPN8_DERSI|nr:hypothetical protein HPB49_005010 [Dermacentor silvarum]